MVKVIGSAPRHCNCASLIEANVRPFVIRKTQSNFRNPLKPTQPEVSRANEYLKNVYGRRGDQAFLDRIIECAKCNKMKQTKERNSYYRNKYFEYMNKGGYTRPGAHKRVGVYMKPIVIRKADIANLPTKPRQQMVNNNLNNIPRRQLRSGITGLRRRKK